MDIGGTTMKLIEHDPSMTVKDCCNEYHEFLHTAISGNNPTGIANEEGEFLYGLVRMLRPTNVLETGTNIGVSTRYIAQGLFDNKKGRLVTIEHDKTCCQYAAERLVPYKDYVEVLCGDVGHYTPPHNLDLLWLDTELRLRYGELVRFFPKVVPGGIICIHDLWCLDFNEFGGVPDQMKKWLRSGELRVITFQTPHGVTMFQKAREVDYARDILEGK